MNHSSNTQQNQPLVLFKDAEILGDPNAPELRAVLNKKFRFMLPTSDPLYWERREVPLAQLLGMFCTHRTSKGKGGFPICPSTAVEWKIANREQNRKVSISPRRKETIESAQFLAIDVDRTSKTFDEIVERVSALGVLAVVHTTHSHAKYVRKGEGDRVRIVFFLAEPILFPHAQKARKRVFDRKKGKVRNGEFAKLTKEQAAERDAALNDFASIYAGLAIELGLHAAEVTGAEDVDADKVDAANGNPLQVAYLPSRTPRAGDEWGHVVIYGPLLDPETAPRAEPLRRVRGPSGGGRALGERDVRPPIGADGFDFLEFWCDYRDELDAESIMDALGVETGPQTGDGGISIRCPNEAQHSDGGGGAITSAARAKGDHDEDDLSISCLHDHCAGLRTFDFLRLISDGIDAGEIVPPDQYSGMTAGQILCDQPMSDQTVSPEYEHYLTDPPSEEEDDNDEQEDEQMTAEVITLEATSAPERTLGETPEETVEREEAEEKLTLARVRGALFDRELAPKGWLLDPGNDEKAFKAACKKYKIKVNKDDPGKAYDTLRREVERQMLTAMEARFDYVVDEKELSYAVRREPGKRPVMLQARAIPHIYANQKVKYIGQNASGKPAVRVIDPVALHKERPERKTFVLTCFEPDASKAASAAREGKYNTWPGFAVEGRPGGDWSLLRDHIRDNICNGDPEHFAFFMTWIASMFARPGVKVPSSVVVRGEQGTGKSKVFDWIRHAIGDASFKGNNPDHLTGRFNEHMQDIIFLTLEEAVWGGDKAARGKANDIISSDVQTIEEKNRSKGVRPNYVSVAIVSNEDWVVPTHGPDARRFFVLTCGTERKQDGAYFAAIDAQMRDGGAEAMVHELQNWNPADVGLTWESLRSPPVTEELRNQTAQGVEGPLAILFNAVEGGELSGRLSTGEAFEHPFNEDKPTYIPRAHVTAALGRYNARGTEALKIKKALEVVGAEDSGQNKMACGSDPNHRVRYVTFPPLVEMEARMQARGRA